MVQILDSTLREGEQTPGVYFPIEAKIAIAKQLDKVGVDIIEAGHPLVSPSIKEAVNKIANLKLKAVIGAHSRSLQEDVDVALDCGVDFLGVFYCVSDERLNGVYKKELNAAINQITKIIRYAKEQKPSLIIRYTPEDTVRSNFENVVQASVEAVRAGADIISVADTTGYMVPGVRSMYDFVSNLKECLERNNCNPKISVHCHDDRGLALANALEGYRAGANIIDATVLKLGERAGLVDLATLLVVLTSDFNEKNNWNLKELTQLYRKVSNYSGKPIPNTFPVMGTNAFTHCAGIHTHAAIINPLHYQSLDPSIVGRKMKVCLDHMSGVAAVRYALEQIGEKNPDKELIDLVKSRARYVGESGKTVSEEYLKDIVDAYKHLNY